MEIRLSVRRIGLGVFFVFVLLCVVAHAKNVRSGTSSNLNNMFKFDEVLAADFRVFFEGRGYRIDEVGGVLKSAPVQVAGSAFFDELAHERKRVAFRLFDHSVSNAYEDGVRMIFFPLDEELGLFYYKDGVVSRVAEGDFYTLINEGGKGSLIVVAHSCYLVVALDVRRVTIYLTESWLRKWTR